jgi:DNA-binding transcriptional regulator YhcF (GntR family)
MDDGSRLPLHVQIEATLANSIANGELTPGTRLPSENTLIERFAVSRTTLRTAIQSLIGRGLVQIRRGKGTFVAQPVITQELTELTGFVEDMQALGRQASAQVQDRRIVAASETVARQLALPRGAAVARIQRVRLADGVCSPSTKPICRAIWAKKLWPTIWSANRYFRCWNRNMRRLCWRPSTAWQPSPLMARWRAPWESPPAARYF